MAEILELAEPGLRRVAAIVEAVGESATVLVDCHSRFEVHAAPVIGDRLAELGVGWFEEPLDPVKYPGELTVIADSSKIPLAGGENGYGADFFEGLVTAKAVETVMPDVKHCGGVAEAYRAGVSAVRAGGRVSLHSPSGPLSQLAGAHVTAAVPGAFNLEHAVNEVPWRAELLFPPEVIRDGRLEIPEGVGLGAELDRAMVERHGRTWRP